VGVYLLVELVLSNGFWSCVGGNIAIGGFGGIKYLWEHCWWECSYWWGWCEQLVMGAFLVGVQLFLGLV